MDITDLYKDTRQRQRQLKLAGLYTGRIDGVAGPLTTAAWQRWLAMAAEAKAKYGTLDERSERNLATVLPELQHAIREWMVQRVLLWAAKRNLAVRVICGTRSYAEQDALYEQGRSKPGKRVTNARGGYSNHNFGIAVDIGIFDLSKTGAAQYDSVPDKTYRELAKECGLPAGCLWGGNWQSMPDAPHYQLAKWGSTTAAVREAIAK